MGKFNAIFPEQVLNNQELVLLKERSFVYALREVTKLIGTPSDWVSDGYILHTHGFIFEHTAGSWIRRPENYLCEAEIAKRFPKKWQRRAFYAKRAREKQLYYSHRRGY